MKVLYNLFIKTRNRVYSNRAVHSRKIRGETASSNTYSDMSEISGKRGKQYVDHLRDRSKHTCLIYGLGNLSDECKVLGEFGSKYSKRSTTRNRGPIILFGGRKIGRASLPKSIYETSVFGYIPQMIYVLFPRFQYFHVLHIQKFTLSFSFRIISSNI